jgi:2-succinyl-5-enolpyruvyl-6-hydroxy-3-cyclohexene-1-carboxylate synthase
VDEWLQCGVRHAVVSPGSRSTPIALEIANRQEIEMHIFHDERSAAFAALGIAKASGIPAILVCSSGTAAVEFHPAVVEAHHSEVPILICTADRPAELQGVGAPQTIDQQNLYGVSVRKFVNAEVADESESHTWRKIARDLFATSLGKVRGPVHLNLRFREPLMGVATSLPPRHERSAMIADKVDLPSARSLRKLKKALNFKNGVIIAGPENYQIESIFRLAQTLSWPVLADPRSGARVPSKFVVAAADSILRDEDFAKKLQPQVVLRFGTLPASKVVNSWLASSVAKQIVITTTPTLADPDQLCALHIVGEIDELCAELVSDRTNGQNYRGDFSWLDLWDTAESSAQKSINAALADEPGLSEPGVARALYGLLPEASNLVVSSSMPIRDVEWFAAPRTGLRVHANRGANGIDGVVSTAVGIALATRQPTTLLIGDIALLHDVNGLIGLVSREIDLRIVVIDNNGGGIFSFLPQAQTLELTKFEKIFGTPHGVNLKMVAQAHQINTHEVANMSDFAEVLSQRGPWLARVVTDRQENVKVHERINQMVASNLR